MKENLKKIKAHKGFTLLELMIVMIISGVILVMILTAYQQYLIQKKIDETKSALQASATQITYFFASQLRYPCPSDRSLPPDDPNFGREFDANCAARAAAIGAGNCSTGNGFCVFAGTRDTDADPDNVADLIVIGGVPINSFRDTNQNNVDSTIIEDGWSGLLSYAVSVSLTNNSTYNFDRGVIRAVDEFGQPTAGITNDAHYVLISHGDNQIGGFMTGGGAAPPCGSTAVALDNENCNNDATFVQALGLYQGNTVGFYDDYVLFSKSQSSSLWSYIPGTNNIQNLNTQNIGIGTDTPARRLDVAGNIRTSNNIVVNQICLNSDNTNCLEVERIAQDITGSAINIKCRAGEVMEGISLKEARCVTPTFDPIQTNFICPPGKWVNGFSTTGDVICFP